MDIFKRNQDPAGSAKNLDDNDKEFEDLGRSARLKEIEKGFQEVVAGAASNSDKQGKTVEKVSKAEIHEMTEFEKEWFSFLEE